MDSGMRGSADEDRGQESHISCVPVYSVRRAKYPPAMTWLNRQPGRQPGPARLPKGTRSGATREPSVLTPLAFAVGTLQKAKNQDRLNSRP